MQEAGLGQGWGDTAPDGVSFFSALTAELQPGVICPFLLKPTLYGLVLVKFWRFGVKH